MRCMYNPRFHGVCGCGVTSGDGIPLTVLL